MGHLVLAGDELLWRQMVITIVPPSPHLIEGSRCSIIDSLGSGYLTANDCSVTGTKF
jgi:hypothetical protein